VIDLIDTIGEPLWILAHSAGGPRGVTAAKARNNLVNGLILIEPTGPPTKSDFPDLAGMDMLGIYGDYIASRNQTNRKLATEAAAVLFNQNGGTSEVISLPDDLGIFGNSHIYMQDNNSDFIEQLIVDWLDSLTLPPVPTVDSCILINIEDFENGWGIWLDGGEDVELVTDPFYASSGNNSIQLRDNSDTASAMTTLPLDLSAYEKVDISFSYLSIGMEAGKDFFLEISTDAGQSFSIIQTFVSGTDFSDSIREAVDIQYETTLSTNTRLRIRCDGFRNNDRVYIDEVTINGCIEVPYIDTCRYTDLQLKVALEGNMDYSSSLMDDQLRQLGMIPLVEPYTNLGYPVVGTPPWSAIQDSATVLGVTGSDAIVDWILIKVHDGDDPTVIYQSTPLLLQRDGDIVELDGVTPYQLLNLDVCTDVVTIYHRNHLGVQTTKGGIGVTTNSQGNQQLDFTNNSIDLVGSNPVNSSNTIQVLWAGNANNDNTISAPDRSATWNDRNRSEYLLSDVNLDGTVNATDRSIVWNNRNRIGIQK